MGGTEPELPSISSAKPTVLPDGGANSGALKITADFDAIESPELSQLLAMWSHLTEPARSAIISMATALLIQTEKLK